MQAREDEEDAALLVNISSSKGKSQHRPQPSAGLQNAPLPRSRLAFTSDAPSTSVRHSEHGTSAQTDRQSMQTVQSHDGVPVDRSSSHRDASPSPSSAQMADAAHASPAAATLDFDIDVSPAVRVSAATEAAAAAAASPDAATLGFDIDVSPASPFPAVDKSANDGPATGITPAVASPAAATLNFDIDVSPASHASIAHDRLAVPEPLGRQSSPSQEPAAMDSDIGGSFSTAAQGPTNVPGQDPGDQQGEDVGLDFDIDDATAPSAPGLLAEPHADQPHTCFQTAAVTCPDSSRQQPSAESNRHAQFSFAPAAIVPGTSDSGPNLKALLLPKPALVRTGFSHGSFKPPRRSAQLLAPPPANPVRASSYAATKKLPTSSNSAAGASVAGDEAADQVGLNHVGPDDVGPDQGGPDQGGPARSLKRLRRASQPITAPSPASTPGSSTSRPAPASGKKRILQHQSRLAAASQDQIEDEEDDEELQAGLLASSQHWQQEQQQQQQQQQQSSLQHPNTNSHQHRSSVQHSLDQQQEQEQQQPRRRSWYGHRQAVQPTLQHPASSKNLLAARDSSEVTAEDDDSDFAASPLRSHSEQVPSRQQSSRGSGLTQNPKPSGFMSASAYAAAAKAAPTSSQNADERSTGTDGACQGKGIANRPAPSHTGHAGFSTARDATQQQQAAGCTSFAGFSTAHDVMQQQRDSDKQAKSDLLKSSNPFARARAQSQQV